MINFKTKLDLIKSKKYFPKCDLKSIINCPVIIKGKCIGVITDYNLNTDEASGFLFNNLCFNFNQDKKIIQSMEIIQDHSDVFEVYKNIMKEKIVQILIDDLNYCYCDNCKYNNYEVYGDRFCDECHRKYSNWALSPITAEEIVNKIIQLSETYPISEEESERAINNAE